jgi:hypothetical protein
MACTIAEECLTTYGCGFPQEPLDGAVFSPFVIIKFYVNGEGEKTITVGNASSPPYNSAAITSFNYGFVPGTNGWGADFEIIDQGGVIAYDIIAAVNKSIIHIANETSNTSFDFGWIITSCDAAGGQVQTVKKASQINGELHGFINEIEQSFEGGKIRLKFKVTAPSAKASSVHYNGSMFDENEKGSLRQAIERLFTENNLKYPGGVKFLDKDGTEGDFAFEIDGANGPKGAWPMMQLNPIAIARAWLSSIVTKNKKGIISYYDPTEPPSIVFQEDPIKDRPQCCLNTIGTYIVNGGNCSPVLEFNPKINWQKTGAEGAGGNSGGASNGQEIQNPDLDTEERSGPTIAPVPQQHELMWRDPSDLAAAAAFGNAAHIAANAFRELGTPIGFEAELKIHGNPEYTDVFTLVSSTVAIIVVNPFHIGDDCKWNVAGGEFLAYSACNTVLSNQNYLIKGISHQISGGSYTTTLNVYLPQPNHDIPFDYPSGGCGTLYYGDGLGGTSSEDANFAS